MHRIVCLATTSLIAGLLAATAPSAALGASGSTPCHPPSYIEKRKIVSSSTEKVITHAREIPLAPGSTWSKATTIGKVATLSSEAELTANAKVEAGKVIAKASVEVGFRLKRAGSRTESSSVTETVTQRNDTNRNRTFVAFSGWTKAHGRFYVTQCTSRGKVVKRFGDWRSYALPGSGTVACWKKASPGGLQQVAKARYCP